MAAGEAAKVAAGEAAGGGANGETFLLDGPEESALFARSAEEPTLFAGLAEEPVLFVGLVEQPAWGWRRRQSRLGGGRSGAEQLERACGRGWIGGF